MHCTKCGVQLADGARFCGNCGEPVATGGAPSPVSGTDVRPAPGSKQPGPNDMRNGCIGIAAFGIIGMLLISECTSDTPEQKAAVAKEAAQKSAAAAQDKQKGLHCLSKWDGSSRQLVDAVKAGLRDPESFEHEETRITPLKGGKHAVLMNYRAKNGFGGYNKAVALGSVDHQTCAATLLANE